MRLESISVAEPSWDNVEPLCRDGITEPWQEEVTEVKKTLGGSGEGVPGCGIDQLAWSGGGTTSSWVVIVGSM